MLDCLDARGILRWLSLASAAMDAERATIDALNVFPVPDNDTGTNLSATLIGAVEAARQLIDTAGSSADRFEADRFQAEVSDADHRDDDRAGGDRCREARPTGVRAVAEAAARGAAIHARGNSGVILAQLLRGFAEALPADADRGAPRAEITGLDVARALVAAADHGYEAVADPVEGTVLSVARAAGQAAAAAARAGGPASASPLLVTMAAVSAGRAALARTRSQLPALTAAGVVDAGGYGLILVLEALSAAVSGPVTLPAAPIAATIQRIGPSTTPPADHGPAYEVQYLLDADPDRVAILRSTLSLLGDSVVIAAIDDRSWNVHAHVHDVGAAVEAGVVAGRPHAIRVTRFADAVASATDRAEVRSANRPVEPPPAVAIVAIAPGEGLADLFRREGVHVVEARPDRRLTEVDVLEALHGTAVAAVVVLPSSVDVWEVAESAAVTARTGGLTVAVVPIRSPVQGLAAVAVHDPNRRFDDDVIRMAETAASTRWAEITVADREALTMAGHCYPGEVLGLIGGEVVHIGRDVASVAEQVIDRLLGVGGELVTVLLGANAPDGIGPVLVAHIHRVAPHVEVSVLAGGQPHHPLLVGVE